MDGDFIFVRNRDWDPEYLRCLFDEDFNDMSYLWRHSSDISDEDIVKADPYRPIVEDISMDDDTLREAVESIENHCDLPRYDKVKFSQLICAPIILVIISWC